MPTNNFLEFCPTDSGTNLPTQGAYAADADRVSGNKPGVASSKLNNKALRQANYITSQLAQLTAEKTNTDVLDDATPAKLLAQLKATLSPLAPVTTSHLSGSGTHNLSYVFFIATGNATAAATYTNNGITYTVKDSVASGLQVIASGSGAPTASGTLTKTGGGGDSTLTFYAVRAPLAIRVKMVGGGGGGGGGGDIAPTDGTNGGNTTFGTTLLVANGGVKGVAAVGAGGAGGSASLGTGPAGLAIAGGSGSGGGSTNVFLMGGVGGASAFGGAGGGAAANATGLAAAANSGSGGGGGGSSASGAPTQSGSGGGAGGYVEADITSPLSSYAYAVGAAGAAGAGGGGGFDGGAGAAGCILVQEFFQ